jgi:hypothetical protein
MSRSFREPPDLAVFNDLDKVLNKIGDITVREPVRQYYRMLYYVQQTRSVKWCLFALFITLFFEFQIDVLLPNSKQMQAFVALIVSVAVLGALWVLERALFQCGGDPAELFETRDEEMALAQELGNIALSALPVKSHSLQAVSPMENAKLSALFEVPDDAPTTESVQQQPWHANRDCFPLAKINKTAASRSPLLFNAAPKARAAAPRQVRAGLLNFNASLLGDRAASASLTGFASLKKQ